MMSARENIVNSSPIAEPKVITVQIIRLAHFLSSLTTWRVILTLVSGATTLLGMMLLYDFFGSGHGAGSVGFLRYIIPVSLAGSIHAAIFWALDHWATLRRPKYLLIAVPLQILAVVASYGTHWTHMRGGSVTVDEFVSSQTTIVRGIRNFAQSYLAMANETAELAAHSEAQAKIEAETGKSCGTNAKVGKGPRYELRMADRDTYSSFNTEIGARAKQLNELVDRAEKANARSADEAINLVSDLRRIVNETKTFEADPLLAQLKQSVQKRLLKSKSPIEISPLSRAKQSAATFSCPDAALDRRLVAVLDAITALKPVAEVDVKDARDPRVGFAIALRRLATSVFGAKLLPLSRDEQTRVRRDELALKSGAQEGLRSEDIAPLIVAVVIEAALTLLFAVGGGSLPTHPGLIELADVINRRRQQVFDKIWVALGGTCEPGAVRRVISRFAKFEGTSALVVVPVYSGESDVQLLHDLMVVLASPRVRLAKCIYSGRHLASLFTFGWTTAQRENALNHGAVRIYRMSGVDYLALILDALQGAEHGEASSAQPSAESSPIAPQLMPDHRATDIKVAA